MELATATDSRPAGRASELLKHAERYGAVRRDTHRTARCGPCPSACLINASTCRTCALQARGPFTSIIANTSASLLLRLSTNLKYSPVFDFDTSPRQRRSQECELGGAPLLPSLAPSLPCLRQWSSGALKSPPESLDFADFLKWTFGILQGQLLVHG